jgi:hypothetical protein
MLLPPEDGFIYRQLPERDSILLLLLKPAAHLSAKVECQILETTLRCCAQGIFGTYIALSYVWNHASDRRRLKVNGEDFDVTANLDSALPHLGFEENVVCF